MNRSDLRVIADRSIFRSKIAGEKEEEEERERERAKRGVGLVVETSLFLAENSPFFRRVELRKREERKGKGAFSEKIRKKRRES